MLCFKISFVVSVSLFKVNHYSPHFFLGGGGGEDVLLQYFDSEYIWVNGSNSLGSRVFFLKYHYWHF